MSSFNAWNSAAFMHPHARSRATGHDPSGARDLVDEKGNVLARITNGGMINPSRHELRKDTVIFRFGAIGTSPRQVKQGEWWLEQREFEKIQSFGQVHRISAVAAARFLCLVPPEWSNMGTLIRARANTDLLCYRGLGNSVYVPKKDGLGDLRLPHQNDISARRTFQLYIPGLFGVPELSNPLSIEQSWTFPRTMTMQGWLYL